MATEKTHLWFAEGRWCKKIRISLNEEIFPRQFAVSIPVNYCRQFFFCQSYHGYMYYRTGLLHLSSKLFVCAKSNLFQVQSNFASSFWIPIEKTVLQITSGRPLIIHRNSLKLHFDTCQILSSKWLSTYHWVPLNLNTSRTFPKLPHENHLRKQYFSEKMSEESKSEGKKRKLENGETAKSTPAAKKGKEEDFLLRIAESRSEVCQSVAEFKFNKKRVRVLSKAKDFPDESKGVVYWMSRDQRVQDNWALLYAQRLALKMEIPLHVCFCLVPKFLEATIRQFDFMLNGLKEVEKECKELNISFHLLIGYAKDVLPEIIKQYQIGGLVTDFSPLRVPAQWVKDVQEAIPKDIPLCQVDAHNVVPCWEASPKLEYGARTIRSKINGQLSTYLTAFPPVCVHPHKSKETAKPVDWEAAFSSLEVDRVVPPVDWAKPGTTGGHKVLESFCKERLKYFGSERNNPNKDALSNLSPWIHFGQVSVQRCVLMVRQYRSRYKESVEAFIEESVVRRELADNFCYYNKHYDSIEGAYDWAKETLKAHEKDKRTHVYTREQLEKGKTHEPLWNAAQNQMVNEGKMHGFMRMYWAKKILEWTSNPTEALEIAIYLNDKYSLDGRDPNGYVGCMWSICGIHDQGWKEREVFGKIRYMNYNGCKRKFDVGKYEAKYRRQTIIK